jgi:hemerythrin superfamily protein
MKQMQQGPGTMKQQNALDILQQDHQQVEQMMQQFQSQGMQDEQLAEQICRELLLHTKLEQDLFYPAVRAGTDQDAMTWKFVDEHDEVISLIDRINMLAPEDTARQTLFNDMIKDVRQHIQEEEQQLFPAVRAQMGGQLAQLGQQLAQHKQVLMQQLQQINIKSAPVDWPSSEK